MTSLSFSKQTILLLLIIVAICLPFSAKGDESLAIYGLKGYAFTFSPIPADGFYFQTGAMYSKSDGRVNNADGYRWIVPVSMTYGDGKWWEISAATHWEYWENTSDYWQDREQELNPDLDQKGTGDVFIGSKIRLLGAEKGIPLDVSLMPYILIPGNDRDKSIGDIYMFNPTNNISNPTDDDNMSYGINLLLGRQLKSFYLAGNLGLNYIDGNPEMKGSIMFLGLAVEYQFSETLSSYLEFMSVENRTECNPCNECPDCYEPDATEDLREVGAGIIWLINKWGLKLHAGTGLSDTTPNVRGLVLINRNF